MPRNVIKQHINAKFLDWAEVVSPQAMLLVSLYLRDAAGSSGG
jgi:hypothetical protein